MSRHLHVLQISSKVFLPYIWIKASVCPGTFLSPHFNLHIMAEMNNKEIMEPVLLPKTEICCI